ncbi:MAG TPA: FecR domain-containing protein [Ignavibacteria bacterium]|nr:FecR domain-containing protein [Ignavibacteria bacterium]
MKTEKNTEQLKCVEIELLIDEHLEGMIALSDKEIMEEHISKCDSCRKYLQETESLLKKTASIPQDAVNLSVQKKNDLWKSVESKIDKNKYSDKKPDKSVYYQTENAGPNSFFYKYRYIFSGLAAALVVGFIVFGVKNLKLDNDRLTQQSTFGLENYWKVSNIQGNSLIGNSSMSSTDSIKEGQWIQTNGDSRAELIVANIGKVIIEPNSKIVFLKGADGNNRIMVEYGTINTVMNPNTRSFFVEMPSAVATDNGGSYTMTVDSTGDGLVYVRSGKVEIASPNRDAIIPAGSIVLTKRNLGVGTPFNENSSAKFKSALFNYDFGNCNDACVKTLLNSAKMSDAVTLVNLIPNVNKEYSDQVYTKLAAFVPPPTPVRGDSIPFMNEEEINKWVDKIQLEVQENVERSMKNVEKSLEQLKKLETIDPETINGLEDLAKNWKFQIKTSPDGTYEWDDDTVEFDKEQFKKDMEEMKEDIKNNSKFNKEQLKADMEDLKNNLEEMKSELRENLNLNNEELKKELQKANEEMRKAMKDVEKIKIPDSINQKIKVYPKDGFENTEEPEAPEAPVETDSDE